LNTNKVKLRSLVLADALQLTKLADNIKIWNNLRDYFPHPYYEDDAQSFINLSNEKNPRQNFGIQYGGEICGVISLIMQEDVYKKTAEIGYWIGEPYWGKQVASEAVRLITEYGFKELNLIRVYAAIFEDNIGSMKVLEKNGYSKEGVFKKAVIKNNQVLDEHRYYKLNTNII